MNNFSAISWPDQVGFRWNNEDVCFILDQCNTISCVFSASSMKWQSGWKHVAPPKHIITIPSQPIFAVISYYCALEEILYIMVQSTWLIHTEWEMRVSYTDSDLLHVYNGVT